MRLNAGVIVCNKMSTRYRRKLRCVLMGLEVEVMPISRMEGRNQVGGWRNEDELRLAGSARGHDGSTRANCLTFTSQCKNLFSGAPIHGVAQAFTPK